MSEDYDHVHDMLDGIQEIEECRRLHVGTNGPLGSSPWAIAFHLEVIADAARSISSPARSRWKMIPWSLLVEVGNILDRARLDIDGQELWATTERDIPELRRRLEAIVGQVR